MGTKKDIRQAVEAELQFDPLLDDSGILVRNINGVNALEERACPTRIIAPANTTTARIVFTAPP